MNQFTNKLIQLLIKNESIKIESIILTGSKVNKTSIDFWSDIDLIIVLKRGENLNKEAIAYVISTIGLTICKEEYESKNTLTQRMIISQNGLIERFDLTICTYENWARQEHHQASEFKVLYGNQLAVKRCQEKMEFSLVQVKDDKDRINKIWFLLFECVKKFMRNDNLIGLHLLLELMREYLVLRMQERDAKYQTNIHKYGHGEKLPKLIEFEQIKYQNKLEILKYLESISIEIDKQLMVQYEEYESKIGVFRKYLKENERQIKK